MTLYYSSTWEPCRHGGIVGTCSVGAPTNAFFTITESFGAPIEVFQLTCENCRRCRTANSDFHTYHALDESMPLKLTANGVTFKPSLMFQGEIPLFASTFTTREFVTLRSFGDAININKVTPAFALEAARFCFNDTVAIVTKTAAWWRKHDLSEWEMNGIVKKVILPDDVAQWGCRKQLYDYFDAGATRLENAARDCFPAPIGASVGGTNEVAAHIRHALCHQDYNVIGNTITFEDTHTDNNDNGRFGECNFKRAMNAPQFLLQCTVLFFTTKHLNVSDTNPQLTVKYTK